MIKITVNISKKVPITGIEFSSQTASCSVEAELPNDADPVQAAHQLYAKAEGAVDAQLGLQANPSQAVTTPTRQSANHGPQRSHHASTHGRQASRSSRPSPYRRRDAPPSSAAQQRLLRRLLDDCPNRGHDWLAERGVTIVEDTNMAEASALIDELKAGA